MHFPPGARLLPYRPGNDQAVLLVRVHPHLELSLELELAPENSLLRSYHQMLDSLTHARASIVAKEAKIESIQSEDIERMRRRRGKLKEFISLAEKAKHKVQNPEFAVLALKAIKDTAKVDLTEIQLNTLRTLMGQARPKQLANLDDINRAIDLAESKGWLYRPHVDSVVLKDLGLQKCAWLMGSTPST